jgi:alpha-tubulin suppressor-like RCC1 family protein
MTTGFKIKGVDWDDKFVRRDIFTEGGLWVWGRGTSGGLGDNTITHRSSPIQTVAGGTNWKEVLAGGGIKTDGSMWRWGYNAFGDLGISSTTHRSSPVQVVGTGTWKQATYGGGVKTDGSLWSWGYNGYGDLGDNTRTDRTSPVQTVAGGTNWKQYSRGGSHAGGLKTDGTLWMWGANANFSGVGLGQLGDDTSTHRSSPVQVIGTGSWKMFEASNYYSAGIKTDGTLWLWGDGGWGVFGNNLFDKQSSPIQTIAGGTNWRTVSCGSRHVVAIKTDGTLWVWGSNSFGGPLGTGNNISYYSPVQTIAGGTNWKRVSAGTYTTSAIKTDGSLWSWGHNGYGQLGDGTITNRSSPVQTISGGSNWKNVMTSSRATYAIREDYYN